MINPLAGQGVNIGLLDAAALAEVLLNAVQQGESIADVKILKRYEQLRRAENLKMMWVMEAFYRVFSNDILPVKFLRNLGLGLAERIRPAKNKLMLAAMGLEGNLPKLARGKSIL
jgi:3-demethoxyubiquinol 3-hydroxylase